jgi:uncharacterized membrane protein YheB (UPF0754 family)
MGTNKAKLQAYLDDLISQRFNQWKEERGIKENSAALNQLLGEYFGLGTSSELFLASKPQELRALVAEEVNHSLIHLREQVEEQGKVLDELWAERAERNNNRWLDEASLKIIRERLDKLEERLVSESPTQSSDSPVNHSPEKKTRAELARMFHVTVEGIRVWESKGELERRGWIVAPDSLKSPRQYIPVNRGDSP